MTHKAKRLIYCYVDELFKKLSYTPIDIHLYILYGAVEPAKLVPIDISDINSMNQR